MSKCRCCFNEIGTFDLEFKCKHCGKTLCWNCANRIYLQYPIEYYECFGAKIDFDWYVSMGFNYTGCSCCKSWLNNVELKMKEAFEKYEVVETYSVNYKGKVKKENKPYLTISTPWLDDRDKAKNFIKAVAFYYGYRSVYNLEFEKDTANSGNYYYSIWRITGNVGK